MQPPVQRASIRAADCAPSARLLPAHAHMTRNIAWPTASSAAAEYPLMMPSTLGRRPRPPAPPARARRCSRPHPARAGHRGAARGGNTVSRARQLVIGPRPVGHLRSTTLGRDHGHPAPVGGAHQAPRPPARPGTLVKGPPPPAPSTRGTDPGRRGLRSQRRERERSRGARRGRGEYSCGAAARKGRPRRTRWLPGGPPDRRDQVPKSIDGTPAASAFRVRCAGSSR